MVIKELYEAKINHLRTIVVMFNKSQSIDINSIHLNKHAQNDCESTPGSDNIATRVRAKNAKVRQKKFTRNHNILQLGIETTRLLLRHFHTNITPTGISLLWT